MVLRLHAPLAFQRRTRVHPPPRAPPCTLALAFFPICPGFPSSLSLFLPFISISPAAAASLFPSPFPAMLFSPLLADLLFSLARGPLSLSLFLPVRHRLRQNWQITLLVVMSSMKHYTRRCHSSRRGLRERHDRTFPDATPQNRREA